MSVGVGVGVGIGYGSDDDERGIPHHLLREVIIELTTCQHGKKCIIYFVFGTRNRASILPRHVVLPALSHRPTEQPVVAILAERDLCAALIWQGVRRRDGVASPA